MREGRNEGMREGRRDGRRVYKDQFLMIGPNSLPHAGLPLNLKNN